MGHEFGSYGEIGWVSPPPGWLGGAHAAVSLRGGGSSLSPFGSLNLGRTAGDTLSRVDENERRLTAALRLPGPAARARLEHGTRCLIVQEPGVYQPCDGLLTGCRALPMWLTVADCHPLFVSAGEWIGLMHCGWRGMAQGAAARLVEALVAASSRPPTGLRAWIGPGIQACCYRVGPEVAGRFPAECIRGESGAASLDLAVAIRRDLMLAGLPDSRIDGCCLCTSCRADLFFSYRREGPLSGRMAAVIWM